MNIRDQELEKNVRNVSGWVRSDESPSKNSNSASKDEKSEDLKIKISSPASISYNTDRRVGVSRTNSAQPFTDCNWKWIFHVNSPTPPAITGILVPTPCRSDLFSDWLKFTIAWAAYYFAYPLCCEGANHGGGGGRVSKKHPWGFVIRTVYWLSFTRSFWLYYARKTWRLQSSVILIYIQHFLWPLK